MSNFLKLSVIAAVTFISSAVGSYYLGSGMGVREGFAEGFKLGELSQRANKFSEPMHSVFITVCMQRGSAYQQCSCIESKVYMLEEDAKAGKDVTFAYEAAEAECSKSPTL